MKKRIVKSIKKNSNKLTTSTISNALLVKKLVKDVCLPEYMMETDVGLDIRANENISLMPMEQKAVKTGIALKIPEGHVGLIRDRAGIVDKIGVHTSAGTFDPAYTGEVSIMLINLGDEEIMIEKGMRIAQLIVLPVQKVQIKEVKELPMTIRGKKGFGSTGIKDKIKSFNKLYKSIPK